MLKYGIYGYGNLGRALELAVRESGEEVTAVFTRRDPEGVRSEHGSPICPAAWAAEYAEEIDILFLATGSARDVPREAPVLAGHFHLVDSYDCHEKIPLHVAAVDAEARRTGHVALLSAGWDPGLFSVFRTVCAAIAPNGVRTTLYGKGVSQGHSEAVRRLAGVRYAKVYTLPTAEGRLLAYRGTRPPTGVSLHRRVCYTVAEAGEEERIRAEIVSMPHYFLGTPTEVIFLSEEEYLSAHAGNAHRGSSVTVFQTGHHRENREEISMSVSLDSNPEFTAAVMLAYGRAALRLAAEGQVGAFLPTDIPPRLLLPEAWDCL